MPTTSQINVLFMAAEADPLIKVGGLGDVAGSLPTALRKLSGSTDFDGLLLDIRLVIPFHPSINLHSFSPEVVCEFPVSAVKGVVTARVYSINLNGLPVYLIAGLPIDHESGVYTSDLEADGYKYVFFSLAALELPKHIDWKPEIYHANDWHTAAAIDGLALRRVDDRFYSTAASILTVHNLPYLGSMTSSALTDFGIPPAVHSDLPEWAQHMALPLGLLAADKIVAVSPGYASEILTEEFGSGLSEFLNIHSEKIIGILNGLDTVRWDPGQDHTIHTPYSIKNISDRSQNKTELQGELGLQNDPSIPLLAMVTRMDPQKGVDLALAAIGQLLESGHPDLLQAVFLGTGDPNIEESARKLEQDYPDYVRVRIIYDERFSRRIYAGADMLLMPSRYEPCGLSQMIAMRYGCVPIARATGGLSDTITDLDDSLDPNGILFDKPTANDLSKAIQRAIQVYTRDQRAWQHMCFSGMIQDFSWDRSAKEYLAQYRRLSGSG